MYVAIFNTGINIKVNQSKETSTVNKTQDSNQLELNQVTEFESTALNRQAPITAPFFHVIFRIFISPSNTTITMTKAKNNALPLSMTMKNNAFSVFPYRSAGIPSGNKIILSKLRNSKITIR